MNPFGTPITNQTLEAMPQYIGKHITQEDRAREALRLIHSEDKNINALSHAVDLKHNYGDGVSTLCLIYNATGGPLELVDKNDWYGNVYKEEPPRSFDNGQWIAFLHVHPTSQAVGSEAARVLRGTTVDGDVRDYLVAWCTRWGAEENNAYTEVREKDHFPQYWDYIRKTLLEKARLFSRDESDPHCSSTVSIGGATTSEFIAVLKHKFGPLPEN